MTIKELSRRRFLKSASGLLLVPAVDVLVPKSRATNFLARPAAGGGESIWKQQTTDNDDWGASATTFAQFIKNTEVGSTTVTKVTCWMHAITTTQNVKVGLWSTANGTGTQYGADSINTSVATGASVEYTWTWAANPSVPAGTDFYIVFTPSLGSSEIQFEAGTDGTGSLYEDTTYCVLRGTTPVASGTSDLVFKLYKTP